MARIFGTDGVRGEANTFLSPELAFKLGKAAACVLVPEKNEEKAIVIGKDTRISGDMLEASLIAGICSMGVDVYKIGVCPTPAVAFLIKNMGAMSGIMISASHNPAIDNGIKFFDDKGFKLPDAIEDEIEKMIQCDFSGISLLPGDKVGRVYDKAQEVMKYEDYLMELFDFDLDGMKIVLDSANGSAHSIMPRILRNKNADLISISDQPDGLNINDNCGSTHLDQIKEEVLKNGAEIGIAHDGDSDRVLLVDKNGNEIDGDMIMALVAKDLKETGKLKNDLLVATVMSNMGLRKFLEDSGVKVLEAKVGDRYVLEMMVAEGASLGGEQSGHVILLDHNTTGDGIMTALKVLEILFKAGKTIDQVLAKFKKYPQVLLNVRVKDKHGWDTNERISKAVSEQDDLLEDRGRILVRASGTEPLIRVMVEGECISEIEKVAKQIADVVKGELA